MDELLKSEIVFILDALADLAQRKVCILRASPDTIHSRHEIAEIEDLIKRANALGDKLESIRL